MKVVLIIAVVLIVVYALLKAYGKSQVAPDIAALAAKGAVILDVRTETEFAGGHIPGAVNLSLGRLRQDYRQLDSTRPIITCCSHGLRSIKAMELLKERGFKQVYNGGAWLELQEKITP